MRLSSLLLSIKIRLFRETIFPSLPCSRIHGNWNKDPQSKTNRQRFPFSVFSYPNQKMAIKFTKFEFLKSFIYELFDDVCCDSEWAEKLFTPTRNRKMWNEGGGWEILPFLFHNLNTLSSLAVAERDTSFHIYFTSYHIWHFCWATKNTRDTGMEIKRLSDEARRANGGNKSFTDIFQLPGWAVMEWCSGKFTFLLLSLESCYWIQLCRRA